MTLGIDNGFARGKIFGKYRAVRLESPYFHLSDPFKSMTLVFIDRPNKFTIRAGAQVRRRSGQ